MCACVCGFGMEWRVFFFIKCVVVGVPRAGSECVGRIFFLLSLFLRFRGLGARLFYGMDA